MKNKRISQAAILAMVFSQLGFGFSSSCYASDSIEATATEKETALAVISLFSEDQEALDLLNKASNEGLSIKEYQLLKSKIEKGTKKLALTGPIPIV